MTDDEGMTKHKILGEADNSFWIDKYTPSVREEPDAKPVYDLEERTARFGEAVIDFAKKIRLGHLPTESLANWSAQGQAWEPIMTKRMMQCLKGNS